MRRTQPAAYLKILALLVPCEHKVEHRNLLKEMTDEELEAAIEFIQKMLGDAGRKGQSDRRDTTVKFMMLEARASC